MSLTRPVLRPDQKYIGEIFDPVSKAARISRAARIVIPIIVLLGGLTLVVLGATGILPISLCLVGAVIGVGSAGTLIYFIYKRNREMDTWVFKARQHLPQSPADRNDLEQLFSQMKDPGVKSRPLLPELGLGSMREEIAPQRPESIVDDIGKERQKQIFDIVSDNSPHLANNTVEWFGVNSASSSLNALVGAEWLGPNTAFHTIVLPMTHEGMESIFFEKIFSIKREILRRITFDAAYMRRFCLGNELELQIKLILDLQKGAEKAREGDPWIVQVELSHVDPYSPTLNIEYIWARIPESRWDKKHLKLSVDEPIELSCLDSSPEQLRSYSKIKWDRFNSIVFCWNRAGNSVHRRFDEPFFPDHAPPDPAFGSEVKTRS